MRYGLGSLPRDPRPSGALRASKMLAIAKVKADHIRAAGAGLRFTRRPLLVEAADGLGSLLSDPRPSGALRASKMLAHFVNPYASDSCSRRRKGKMARLTEPLRCWRRGWTRIAPKRSSPFGRTSCVQNAGAFCEPAMRVRSPPPPQTKRPPYGSLFLLVEAAGIEPASASPPLRGSTCLFRL